MAQIRRLPEQHSFTIVSNRVARDPRLSFRASGILLRLLSEPPDSTINTASLQAERPGKEGRDAVLRALRELEVAGYLARPRRQGARGRWNTEWVVSSVPELPDVETSPLRSLRSIATEDTHVLGLITHAEPVLLAEQALPPPAPIAWPPVDESAQICRQQG